MILEKATTIARAILNGQHIENKQEIFDILLLASDQYYNDGESFLSDKDFDSLEKLAKDKFPEHPYFTEIGSNVRGEKVDLPYPMGSLDQLYENDTEKWVAQHNLYDRDIIITDKEDGVSGLIIYDKFGNLSIAYSRGNGLQGSDITRHVLSMKKIVRKMPCPCVIRVEFILNENLFEMVTSYETKKYKNPRNYVAGKMNSKEATDQFYENISIIGTSVLVPEMSKLDQINFLKNNRYEIPNYSSVKGKDLNDKFLIDYLNERRNESEYMIDGIVIDIDDVNIRNSITRNSSSLNPTFSKKYKRSSSDNSSVATVVKVHYEPSKHGYLKPRIEIEPIDLNGVTIKYTTGFNAKYIIDNGIGEGSIVKITRSGDVIPYITEIITKSNPDLPNEILFGEYEWNETNVDFVLKNPISNDDVIKNQLLSFFEKIEVPHLKDANINELHRNGYITVQSIIKASENELINLFGNIIGSKIYYGIKEKLNPIPLYKLAGSTNIFGRGIGIRKIKKITDSYNLNEVSVEQILELEGFDHITANQIYNNIENFYSFLKDIDGYYSLETNMEVSEVYKHLNVVFTGIRDKNLEEIIIKNGGKISSGISKNTTHLVCKDPTSNSGKLVKAKSLGVNLISIMDARNMWK